MLKVTIPAIELFNDETSEFSITKETTLQLEHSLVSLSKWESKWKQPFLRKDKTIEQTIDYIKCMTITQNVSDEIYKNIPDKIVRQIQDYIDDTMTATTFPKETGGSNREIITAELIYYWMIALNIPLEWEKRHLNRLLTLINVCNIKNSPPKKMSRKEMASRNSALNAARKKKLHSEG